MAEVAHSDHLPGRAAQFVAAALAATTAVALGLAVGYPAASTLLPAGIITGLWVIGFAIWRPFAAFLILVSSTFMLMVVLVSGYRGLNAFDVFIPPLLAVSLIGGARRAALVADAMPRGPRHSAIASATHELRRAALIFYGLMIASIGLILLNGRPDLAGNSLLKVIRGVQGLMLFPLAIWWLRDERRLRLATYAMLAGGIVFSTVNTIAIAFAGVPRAGLGWYLNNPQWPIDSPNEAAPAMLLLVVLLLVRQSLQSQKRNHVMMFVAMVMLVLSQSRSGLLAFLTFALLTVPRAGWKRVAIAVLVAGAALPFVPSDYWDRLFRTLTMAKGSFEAYSSIIRIYSWEAGLRVLLDHPIAGVGFMGFAAVSSKYNELGLVLGGVEQYFLEIAVGMGLIGLTAFAVLLVRLYRIGQVVLREAPQGTMGHALARFHAPLLTGLLVANLTGDNFVGMVGLAQLSLWTALLVRAGHLAVDTVPAGAIDASRSPAA